MAPETMERNDPDRRRVEAYTGNAPLQADAYICRHTAASFP